MEIGAQRSMNVEGNFEKSITSSKENRMLDDEL
jgi:hypothetical protein